MSQPRKKYSKYIDSRKRFMPPLDARINPKDIQLNTEDPGKSQLKSRPSIQLKTSHITNNDLTSQGITLYKTLGSGSFATTYLAQNANLDWIAVKIPDDDVKQWEINEEVTALQAVNNHIPNQNNSTPRMICMKLGQGEALGQVNDQCNLHLLQRIAILKSITKQLVFLHKDNDAIKKGTAEWRTPILHNDLHQWNVLVDINNATGGFCDFAGATPLQKRPASQNMSAIRKERKKQKKKITNKSAKLNPAITRLWSLFSGKNPTIGTACPDKPIICELHLAPELIHGKPPTRSEASEIYSLGMTFATFLNKTTDAPSVYYPYYKSKIERLGLKANPKAPDPNHIPDKLYQLIQRMLHDDPRKRPTVLEVAIELNQILRQTGRRNSPLRTCMISIDEFLNLSDSEKEVLFKAIENGNINAVALQGTGNTPAEDYYQARYEFALHKVSVAPFMVTGKDHAESLCTVKEYYDGSYATLNTKVFVHNMGKLEEAINPLPKPKNKPGSLKRNSWKNVARDALIGTAIGAVALGIIALTLWALAMTFPVWLVVVPVVCAVAAGTTCAIKNCSSPKQAKKPLKKSAKVHCNRPRINSNYLVDSDHQSGKTLSVSNNSSQILIEEQFPRENDAQALNDFQTVSATTPHRQYQPAYQPQVTLSGKQSNSQ